MKVITRALIGAAGISCVLSGAAVPVAQARVSGHAWITAILIRCGRRQTVEPSTIVLTCGTGSSLLTGLHWRSWRAHAAFGQGIQSINSCRPTCAARHFRHHQVLVAMWGIKPLRGHEWYFTHMTLIYTQPRPPAHTQRTVTIALTRRGPA